MILTTDFLRTWQHCPLQAVLCARHRAVPLGMITHSALAAAMDKVGPSYKAPYFRSDELPHQIDRFWSAQADRMDRRTWLTTGENLLERAIKLAETLNRSIDEGWRVVSGPMVIEIPLEPLLGPIGGEAKLAHRADIVLRDTNGLPCLGTYSATTAVNYDRPREYHHCLDIQLNSLAGRHAIEGEEARSVLINLKQSRLVAATLGPSEDRRTLGLIRDTLRALRYQVIPQRTICSFSCDNCPVQSACDDPAVYDTIHDKELKL